MFTEMRSSRRYAAREGTCASFMNARVSPFNRIGQVLDMSPSGIALKYLSNDEGYGKEQPVVIEMFTVARPAMTTGRIPCRVAYDVSLKNSPPGSVDIRRCGLRFEELSNIESCHVEQFMRSCTSLA